eukprot:g76897.t1
MVKIESAKYLLSPELVQTIFVLYRITGKEIYRERAYAIFQAIEKHCKTPTAYTGLNDVNAALDASCKSPADNGNNSMQSSFLAETLKYLFLLFGPAKLLPLDEFVFTAGAHPSSARQS